MIRCLAIDDEILALDLLEDNIRKVPFLEMAGRCRSAMEAMEMLAAGTVDLIFLDIQMPDMSGIQLLNSLHQKPMVIMTTAYEKYALKGYDLDVIDYLLKPFSFERFLRAVNKAQDFMQLKEKNKNKQGEEPETTSGKYLFVKSDYKLVKINLDEIMYIEGLKDYVRIYTAEKPVITLMSMKAVEEKLPASDFVRVHRSFIVNIRKIKYIEQGSIMIGTKEIPIGNNFREQFFNKIKHE
jgi:DNA-binding LytR/AlgR family response regulator